MLFQLQLQLQFPDIQNIKAKQDSLKVIVREVNDIECRIRDVRVFNCQAMWTYGKEMKIENETEKWEKRFGD